MNWYKKSQVGEWWIDNYGQVMYADGDVGDMNHESYVIDHVIGKYIYDEFDHGDWKDWEGFKKELAKEELEEQYGEEITNKLLSDPKQVEDAYLKKLKEMGMTNEEYMIAEQMGDARKYGMEQLGWIRVAGHNIQTFNLTHDDLKRIADGLYDSNDNIDVEDPSFNIEVMSTGIVYSGIPFSIISEGNPSSIGVYKNDYFGYGVAKAKKWHKIATKKIVLPPDIYEKLEGLANRIAVGDRDWSDEDIQLQSNNPEALEWFLRKIKEK